MLLRTLIPAVAGALLIAAPGHAATPRSVTYTTVGESQFTVPAGVHAVDVSLTGARGGSDLNWAPGGRGATVTGTLPVTPGQKLSVEVGGPGGAYAGGSSSSSSPGGSNGGGAGSAGGGGASDIRTLPVADAGSPASRLAVAGGGGGAGYHVAGRPGGGDAGAPGIDSSGGQAGGHPGTQTAGGAGGTGGANGTPGALGQGGEAVFVNFRGGGGGGGYYGGGGGAGMTPCNPCDRNGGGGGGSSLVPAGGTSGLAALTDPAQVTIAYDAPAAAIGAARVAFPATQPGSISASRTIQVTNTTRTTDLNVSRVSLASDDFLVGNSTCDGAVAPGERCRIAVRYAPSANGAHHAELKLVTDAGALAVDLDGDSPQPRVAAPAPSPPAAATAPAVRRSTGASARLHCTPKRCRVEFLAGAPKVRADGTRVRATLTRGGRVFAAADTKSRRGSLRLVLKTARTVAPGVYTLNLRVGAFKSTRTVIA
jgi:hypothetical protein